MSVKMKSRLQSPPNGWQFVIPQLGPKVHVQWSFDALVNEYLEISTSNPRLKLPMDRKQVETLLDTQNAMRTLQIKGADIYVVFSGGAPPPKMVLPRSLAALADAGTSLASGVDLLTDLFGPTRKPVDRGTAECRAVVCARCPMNQAGDWKTIFTLPAAAAIRKMLSILHDLKLETSVDDQLQVCDACVCPMKLKVWCATDLIRSHTTAEQLADFHPDCWIKKELQ